MGAVLPKTMDGQPVLLLGESNAPGDASPLGQNGPPTGACPLSRMTGNRMDSVLQAAVTYQCLLIGGRLGTTQNAEIHHLSLRVQPEGHRPLNARPLLEGGGA